MTLAMIYPEAMPSESIYRLQITSCFAVLQHQNGVLHLFLKLYYLAQNLTLLLTV